MAAGQNLPLAAAGAAVAAANAATAAQSVTRWDSGEFLAAIHSLGIPHPPGAPLYVLAARVWSLLPLPGSFAWGVSLLSVACAVVALVLLGVLTRRWTGDGVAAAAAMLCAGGSATLWLSATEAEAYAPALLFAVLLLFIADRPGRTPAARWALLAFVGGLGWAVHPVSLVTLPGAVLLLTLRTRGGRGWSLRRELPRVALPVAGSAALGVSVVLFMLVRAQHDPAINQGNPEDLRAFWEVLTRAQYADAGWWPRQAPLWLQIGNWLQYADWQFALGVAPDPRPAFARTAISVVFAALGFAGMLAHRRVERVSWSALLAAFVAASLALLLYLNLRLGPSFGHGVLAVDPLREARERDYFFVASFVIWGVWAGVGLAHVARTAGRRVASRSAPVRPAFAGLAIVIAVLPLVLNFSHVRAERLVAGEQLRSAVAELLRSLPPRAVFVAVGDNDTYPLWYAQEVERVRQDVVVVTIPLLGAPWYREELARRHGLAISAAAARGTFEVLGEVCRVAGARSRELFLSPLAPAGTLAACAELRPAPVSFTP